MSKTTAPLLSFDARGQLGDTLVYSSWKGRSYARRYVIPANPRSAGQTLTRNVFRGLNNLWRYMPAAATAAWTLYGDNSRFTARNGWIKMNLSALRAAPDLSDILLSPSAGGGLPLDGITVTQGAGTLTVDATPPALPAGWSIDQVTALAIRQEDPGTIQTPEIATGNDTAEPWSVTLAGLTTGQGYVVGAWARYTKPSGEKAFGTSVQLTLTKT